MDSLESMIFLALAAVAIGLAFFLNGKNRKTCQSLRIEGIRVNRMVMKLLLDLQQHRGMVNAFLNGDSSFKPRLEKKQTEIESGMTKLDALRDKGLLTAQRWDSIRSVWQALRGEVLTLSTGDSFRRHSALIRAVLYSLGDVAERSQIVSTCTADAALVNALWTDIPSVAEGLGQARGLGAGVAAQGRCSSVARIKLRFLEEQISETMGWVSADLVSAGAAQERTASIGLAWEAANKAIHEFLTLLDEKLINVDRPAIDAEHYFNAATKALDAAFSVFNQASDTLEGAVAQGHAA
ncbi:MAG: nitrate- and nitrite sensing domain-containing protein [Betaproteobacteria bacterium]|nr:nitrate- and nitrite sensing domain-containing protein [Betaproteobacteria bacterium]